MPLQFVRICAYTAMDWEADARIRTGDPFITSEVLYQLSYVGGLALIVGAEVGRGFRRLWG